MCCVPATVGRPNTRGIDVRWYRLLSAVPTPEGLMCGGTGYCRPSQHTVSQADEGAVRIPKDRPSYFDISKVPIDGQMSNAFNDNICFI